MKKQQIDHILSKMLDSHDNVSDLNLTPGKSLQVESSGELVPVKIPLGNNWISEKDLVRADNYTKTVIVPVNARRADIVKHRLPPPDGNLILSRRSTRRNWRSPSS